MDHVSARAMSVVKRYRDAYRVANVIVGVSKAFKGIGLALMAVVVLICLILALKGSSSEGGQGAGTIVAILGSLVAGAIVWLVFWMVGVLVGAQGQILLASLDGAVNQSPFLQDEQRAEAMSLPGTVGFAETQPVTAAGPVGLGI